MPDDARIGTLGGIFTAKDWTCSEALIGKRLGHSQTRTTQRYARLDGDPMLKAANLIGSQIAAAFIAPDQYVQRLYRLSRN